ncbi:MAG: dockerin type I repeat-containing protein [Acutalibacteraceae bacterium]
MVLQHIVGIRTLTGTQLLAADVDGVDGVTSTDALMILQYIVGSIKSFR